MFKFKTLTTITTGIVVAVVLFGNKHINPSLDMISIENDPTTLIVTSSPNPENMEALQAYVSGVMPLLLDLGGKVVKRSKITDIYHGQSSFVFLLVMDFPSRSALNDLFESDGYQALIPDRNKGFSSIQILYAEDLP